MSSARLALGRQDDNSIIDLVDLVNAAPSSSSRRNIRTVNVTSRPSGSRPAAATLDVEEIIDLTGDDTLFTTTATASTTPSRASKRQRISPGKRALQILTHSADKQAKTLASSQQQQQQQAIPPLPPPPAAPDSPPGPTCGICLEHMGAATSRQMWSATCGHIYCGDCLKSAVKATKKCPTCRKNLTLKQIHQVFL